MEKPLIGIVSKPSQDKFTKYNSIWNSARTALIRNGARVIAIVPQSETISSNYESYPFSEDFELSDPADLLSTVELCDGILMQGGGVICNYEHLIINYCIDNNIPIFGICCGMTNMALATGGHVDYSREDYMMQNHVAIGVDYKHGVRIDENSSLYSILGKTELKVNSLHRGEITDPGKYRVVARSGDGLIEALEYPGMKFNLGVQWHPELLRADPDENRLLAAFIHAAQD